MRDPHLAARCIISYCVHVCVRERERTIVCDSARDWLYISVCVCACVCGGGGHPCWQLPGAPTPGCVCRGVSPLLWASGGQQGGTGQSADPHWLPGRGSGLAH